MAASKASWYLYLIRCADDTLYTGISTDVARRLAEHQGGGKKCARYLRGRGPLTLVRQIRVGNKSMAAKIEYYVKRLSRRDKERLIKGKIRLKDIPTQGRCLRVCK